MRGLGKSRAQHPLVVPEWVKCKVHTAADLEASEFADLWPWPVVCTASSNGRVCTAQDMATPFHLPT